jgi:hypothetical protein
MIAVGLNRTADLRILFYRVDTGEQGAFTQSNRKGAPAAFDTETRQDNRFAVQVYIKLVLGFVFNPGASRRNQSPADACRTFAEQM